MRYKCLVFDHDDTVVSSTKEIHHPAFLEALRIMRPGETIGIDDYFRFNFHPGFLEYCRDRYQMTDDELKVEEEIWKKYVSTRIPSAFEGIREIMEREIEEGGIIAVSSHSFDFNIKRDYEHNHLPMPSEVFGWELPNEHRKPSPYALELIAEKYHLKPSDICVIDDMKPGFDMAKAFGCDFIAAGWCNDVKEIRDYMLENSKAYAYTVEELEKMIF